jgi:cell division FtsZ-interacting protein ZapD
MDVGARAGLKTEVLKDLEKQNTSWAASPATLQFSDAVLDDVISSD